MRQIKHHVRFFCVFLSLLLIMPLFISGGAGAASGATSIGLAQHGIGAYRDGWQYQSGGKGEVVDGHRVSDCSGLIYAYYKDLGLTDGLGGGSTSIVYSNCIMDNSLSEGIPRIHGLLLSVISSTDQTAPYDHLGIYIGNDTSVDNSDYGINMRLLSVSASDEWDAWHLIDHGTLYPKNGWFALDGKMVHYTNYEYDVNITVDGYNIGKDGYAREADGTYAGVDNSILDGEYCSASEVKAYLLQSFSGEDPTGVPPDEKTGANAVVTTSSLNLREGPSASSRSLGFLYQGEAVTVLAEAAGDTVEDDSKSSDLWYQVRTGSGKEGYVSSLYLRLFSSPTPSGSATPAPSETPAPTSTPAPTPTPAPTATPAPRPTLNPEVTSPPPAPQISCSDGAVTITCEDPSAWIYYTLDDPAMEDDSPFYDYIEPVKKTGCVYSAVAYNGMLSHVTTVAVMSCGKIFPDIENSWYFEAVDKAVTAGLFVGGSDGNFAPNRDITRIEFVTVLAKVAGADLSSYSSSPFYDVSETRSESMWKAVAWASENGYVAGTGNGNFSPDDTLTREQMCRIIAGYLGLDESYSSEVFTDDSSISEWAKSGVYACKDAGIVSGTGGNQFNPKGLATRAQACVVFNAVNSY